jgi:hypothetical protein
MSVYRKLMAARKTFHELELKKTGRNEFAKYNYFELGDFLIPALKVFNEVGLCALPVSFTKETATMTILDVDKPDDRIVFESPMGSAALKGCHEVQNIGAVETYQRRYLWVAALEIVEHDALDATTGHEQNLAKAGSVRHTARGGIGEDLPQDWKDYLRDLAAECIYAVGKGNAAEAAQKIAAAKLDDDQTIYLADRMDAKTRAAIKAAQQEIRKTFNAKEAVTQ